MNRTLALLLVGIVAVTTGARARNEDLAAAWRTVGLKIDGNDTEWPGGASLLTQAPIAVGVMNDGQSVYVRVRITDRAAQMQVLYGGLTIWFDPAGGDKKAFGVKYPVGTPLPEQRRRGPGEPRDPSQPPPSAGEQPALGSSQERTGGRPDRAPLDPSTIVPSRLELFGPRKDDARSLVLDHLPPGIEVSIARVENALVYELEVPLTKPADGQYAIGSAPGARIGIGFETGKIERPQPSERSGGMSGPGGPGVHGPGGWGGGVGRHRGREPEERGDGDMQSIFKPLKAWTRVQLASSR